MKTLEEKAKEFVAEFSTCKKAFIGCTDCLSRYDKPSCESRDMFASYCAGYNEANKWISVKEMLPCLHEEVIIRYRKIGYPKDFYGSASYRGRWEMQKYEEVTHWRPIE